MRKSGQRFRSLNPRAVIRSRSGVTLVELTIAVSISLVSVMAIGSVANYVETNRRVGMRDSARLEKKIELINAISNPRVWLATTNDADNLEYLKCVMSGGACEALPKGLKLRRPNGETLYDHTLTQGGETVGISPDGSQCYGFNLVDGNDACPARYLLTWNISCPAAGPCAAPSIRVNGEYQYKPKTIREPIQASRYSFNFDINLPEVSPLYAFQDELILAVNQAPATIDVLKNDSVMSSKTAYVKSISSPSMGTATYVDGKITYQPNPGAYGMERIDYVIEEMRFGQLVATTGVLWIRVMTPYTWVGDGSTPSILDANNWCGSVVDGKCAHDLGSGGVLSNAHLSTAALVFNENCNSCVVDLEAPVDGGGTLTLNSIELGVQFPGVVYQKSNVRIHNRRLAATGTKQPSDPSLTGMFSQKGGTFVGSDDPSHTLEVARRYPSYSSTTVPEGINAFDIEGGRFIAPKGSLEIIGDRMNVAAAAQFDNNGGTVVVKPKHGSTLASKQGTIVNTSNLQFNHFVFSSVGGGDYAINFSQSFKTVDLTLELNSINDAMRDVSEDHAANPKEIEVSGNINIIGDGGSQLDGSSDRAMRIRVNGIADQTIRSTAAKAGCLSSLIIDKPSGRLTLEGQVCVEHDLEYVRGEVESAGAEVIWGGIMSYNGSYTSTSATPLELANLRIANVMSHNTITAPLVVSQKLILDMCFHRPSSCSMYSLKATGAGRFFVKGDVEVISYWHDTDRSLMPTIELVGDGNQRLIGPSVDPMNTNLLTKFRAPPLPNVVFNKTGGSVAFSGKIGFMGDLSIPAGHIVNAQGASVEVRTRHGIGFGRFDIPNGLTVRDLAYSSGVDLGGSTITVLNQLVDALPDGWWHPYNGTIDLQGDFALRSFKSHSATPNNFLIRFSGIATQTIAGPLEPPSPSISEWSFVPNDLKLNLEVRAGSTVTNQCTVAEPGRRFRDIQVHGTWKNNGCHLYFRNLSSSVGSTFEGTSTNHGGTSTLAGTATP